jgi:hypothetical protein
VHIDRDAINIPGAPVRIVQTGRAMSWQATAWAVKQRTSTAGCKLLLLTLANYADDTGCCWPGQESLKKDTGQSLDTIQRQLKRLQADGLIRKIIRPMGPGRWPGRTYFLNLTVAEISKPQSAAQSDAGSAGGSPGGTMPQDARDHAATAPVTMPQQPRDYAAPVRHEPSLEPSLETSLEASSSAKPKKPSAAERQKAFKEARAGVEVIQNRIARRLGSDGWTILQSLKAADLEMITTLEERGKLGADAIELLRARKPQKERA